MERWGERHETITLPWLWHALRSQWKWVAAGVVLGAGIAAAVVFFGQKRYEAQAKLLIESPAAVSYTHLTL
ncbi:MAG: Wzz/FepE/Etk N-terminal domain-containing protein, partial [Fimbriimonadales bacterium]|nr:Wzz/FepE/Etk N-terminal domain-containing protein [Fimbriimonadales bacterium]